MQRPVVPPRRRETFPYSSQQPGAATPDGLGSRSWETPTQSSQPHHRDYAGGPAGSYLEARYPAVTLPARRRRQCWPGEGLVEHGTGMDNKRCTGRRLTPGHRHTAPLPLVAHDALLAVRAVGVEGSESLRCKAAVPARTPLASPRPVRSACLYSTPGPGVPNQQRAAPGLPATTTTRTLRAIV